MIKTPSNTKFDREILNPDTLVAVCCYSGDAHQVRNNMPLYTHHKCPVVILSPHDSPVKIPPHICRHLGKRAYIGQESLDRQRDHLRAVLEYPFNWFLFNDADSFCLSPRIPREVYQNPNIVWSNEVSDAMHTRPVYVLPRLAFQPPYFLHRNAIEEILKITDQVKADPITPFIDHWMLQVTYKAGLPHKSFTLGASCGTEHDEGRRLISTLVKFHGRVFIHSVKSKRVVTLLTHCRQEYVRSHR